MGTVLFQDLTLGHPQEVSLVSTVPTSSAACRAFGHMGSQKVPLYSFILQTPTVHLWWTTQQEALGTWRSLKASSREQYQRDRQRQSRQGLCRQKTGSWVGKKGCGEVPGTQFCAVHQSNPKVQYLHLWDRSGGNISGNLTKSKLEIIKANYNNLTVSNFYINKSVLALRFPNKS